MIHEQPDALVSVTEKHTYRNLLTPSIRTLLGVSQGIDRVEAMIVVGVFLLVYAQPPRRITL